MLTYLTTDDLPFVVDWNTDANYAAGATFAHWSSGLSEVALATSFEIATAPSAACAPCP